MKKPSTSRKHVTLVNPKNPSLVLYPLLLRLLEKYRAEFNYDLHIIKGGSGLHSSTLRYMNTHRDKYDLLFLHHGEKRYSSKVIDYKVAYYPHLWYFNHGGYAGLSELCEHDLSNPQSEHTINEHYTKEVLPLLSKTKYEKLQQHKDITALNEFLFIPLQVAVDRVMSMSSISTRQMCDRVIEVAKRMNLPVVLKVHPLSSPYCTNRKLAKFLSDNYSNVYVSNADVRDLLDRARATFVINSGVGFESLCRLLPTFTFGKSDYIAATYHNFTLEEIQTALESSIDEKKIKTFLFNWFQHILNTNNEDDMENRVVNLLKEKLL